jgi:hypothetical protein
MKKMMIVAAGTAAAAVLMTSAVLADDISVRTSVGSGEVVFTETSETADISAEELSDLVKDGLKNLDEYNAFNGFLDAEVNVALKVDEENQMALSASAIGLLNKNEDNAYANFFYSLEGLGDPQSGNFEAYHWVDDGTHYTAVSNGDDWDVEKEDIVSLALEALSDSMETDEVEDVSLDALLPNLYEDEDGNPYYVCLYDKDTIMDTADDIDAISLYASMADGILGDNNVKLIVVVDAQTGLLRAVSLDASGISGELPGELLGGEGTLEFSGEDLYVTLLLDTTEETIEIPEEVLSASAEIEDNGLDIDLGGLVSSVLSGGSGAASLDE